ncbi:MAG: T9SS type A sorting domain-containing protein [Saprospiraceae bacterium]|nr:T9SS type A sorting domain-containing protein [Saprospiraceae bacterium]
MYKKVLYKVFIIIHFVGGIFTLSHSQKNDYVWIMGASSENKYAFEFQWGTMKIDFKNEIINFKYDSLIELDLFQTNSSLSDDLGELRLYSNGMTIKYGDHSSIPGLDTIAYGSYWERFNFKNYLPDGSDWPSGLPIRQAILMLPAPNNQDYMIYYPKYEIKIINNAEILKTTALMECKVEINSETNKFIYKDKIISNGLYKPNVTAVKHGNGLDWWIILQDENNKGFNIFLLNSEGITFSHFCPFNNQIIDDGYGQMSVFSPNGQLFITTEIEVGTESFLNVKMYKFNRCNGMFENKLSDFSIPTVSVGSAVFSDNGEFLYITNGNNVFQYQILQDTLISNVNIIAEYDGSTFQYTEWDTPTQLRFSKMSMGPDGKIYIEAPGNARSMHTIEYPDEYGEDATVIQNSIKLETQNFNSLPSFPNFRMGPLDGSSCDTLGLNNMPVAKFRYAQDTSDHLNLRFTDASYFRPETWFWDFGDGQTFEGKKPYWHKYEQSGTYTVCLTVSNENGSDTSCKDIHVGTVSSQDPTNYRDLLTIFPNPVENDLMVRVDGIVPSDMYFEVYNLLGQLVHHQKVYFGLNQYSVSSLAQGSYVYRFVEKNQVLQQGKVVKM